MKLNRYLIACLALAVVIGLGYAFTGTAQQTKERDGAKPTQDEVQEVAPEKRLPKVRSRVEGVSLERVRLSETGDFAEFDIVNNTEKPILSVTVRNGNMSQTYNAYGDEAFIFPGMKSDEGRYLLKNLSKGVLIITAVEFIDGELVGTDYDKEDLRDMRKKQREGKAPKALKSMPAVRTWVGGQN